MSDTEIEKMSTHLRSTTGGSKAREREFQNLKLWHNYCDKEIGDESYLIITYN